MLQINFYHVYINSCQLIQLGVYSVDLYDARRLVSQQTHSARIIKIQKKNISNAFKNIVLKYHLLRSYDFGTVKFTIMKYI